MSRLFLLDMFPIWSDSALISSCLTDVCQSPFRSLKFRGHIVCYFNLYFISLIRNILKRHDEQGCNPLLPKLVCYINSLIHHSRHKFSQLITCNLHIVHLWAKNNLSGQWKWCASFLCLHGGSISCVTLGSTKAWAAQLLLDPLRIS